MQLRHGATWCLGAIIFLALPLQGAEPYSGTVEGLKYTNSFFGLSVRALEGWKISPNTPDVKPGQAKEANADAKAAEADSDCQILFEISRSKDDREDIATPLLSVVVQPLSADAPQTAAGQLSQVVDQLRQHGILGVLEQEMSEELIGNAKFAVATEKIDFSNKDAPGGILSLHQRMLITIRKGYVVLVGLRYSSDDDLKKLEAMLKSLEFKAEKP